MATTSLAQATAWSPSPALLAAHRQILADHAFDLRAGTHAVDAATQSATLTPLKTSLATYQQGLRNSLAAGSLLAVAYQGASRIRTLLEEQKSLAMQANDSTLTDRDRATLQAAFMGASTAITYNAQTTEFGGRTLLDGSLATADATYVALGTAAQTDPTSFTLADLQATALYATPADISTEAGAVAALNAVNTALKQVDHTLSNLRATQERFDDAARFLQEGRGGFRAAQQGLEGLDLASETTQQLLATLRHQTGNAILAQAQRLGSDLLGLLSSSVGMV